MKIPISELMGELELALCWSQSGNQTVESPGEKFSGWHQWDTIYQAMFLSSCPFCFSTLSFTTFLSALGLEAAVQLYQMELGTPCTYEQRSNNTLGYTYICEYSCNIIIKK